MSLTNRRQTPAGKLCDVSRWDGLHTAPTEGYTNDTGIIDFRDATRAVSTIHFGPRLHRYAASVTVATRSNLAYAIAGAEWFIRSTDNNTHRRDRLISELQGMGYLVSRRSSYIL